MESDPNLTGVLFRAIHRAYCGVLQAELSAQGVEMGSPMLMMLLRNRGKDGVLPAQRELADALHVSPAAVAMSLKSLERLGYVKKQTDPADQRRKRVSVTQRGAEAAETCWTIFRAIDRQMMEGFSPEEQAQLRSYHRRMLENLCGDAGFPAANSPDGCKERMECQCSKP